MATYRCSYGVVNCPECIRYSISFQEMVAGYVYKTLDDNLKITKQDDGLYEVKSDNTVGRPLDHDKFKNLFQLDAVGLLAKVKNKISKSKEYA